MTQSMTATQIISRIYARLRELNSDINCDRIKRYTAQTGLPLERLNYKQLKTVLTGLERVKDRAELYDSPATAGPIAAPVIAMPEPEPLDLSEQLALINALSKTHIRDAKRVKRDLDLLTDEEVLDLSEAMGVIRRIAQRCLDLAGEGTNGIV